MQVHVSAGDVYKLNDQAILVYDREGIALRLSDHLLVEIAKSLIARKQITFRDRKERRFTVAQREENLVFDIRGSDILEVKGEKLFPC